MLFALLAISQSFVRITVHPDRVLNTFIPCQVLGAGVDGREKGDIDRIYTAHNLREMSAAGLQPLTYRLRTELAGEAWHWNPVGIWSDPKRHEGYFTGNDLPGKPIRKSYGYRLPRRGNTIDQANDDGYSRIDDGDPKSFWKSNPYLDPYYTHEPYAANPQWIVIDLGKKRPIDTIRIRWGTPYATRFKVDYWEGLDAIMINEAPPGRWLPLVSDQPSTGGLQLIKSETPKELRFLRISLLGSSETAPKGSTDKRDQMGFAVREIEAGLFKKGRLQDAIVHRKNKRQTAIYVSSTDPWHRAVDRDPRVEQPGFDLVFHSGLTHLQPLLTSVPILYDTPENAAAEIAWLKRRHFPVEKIEMGEEPDGQFTTAEHYAALYLQVAKKLKQIDPKLALGGPCFQTTITDIAAWPDDNRSRSWLRRFLDYLKAREHEDWFQFFSFEWYPFDDTGKPTEPQLKSAPAILERVLKRLQTDGLTRQIPWLITEYGYSAFAGPPEVDLPAAILNLDIVAKFLELGGSAAYLYGYEPNEVISEKPKLFGNLMMLLQDEHGQAQYRLPTFWAAHMMVHDWCTLDPKPHQLLATDSQGDVTAYSVLRPDNKIGVLLLNKSKTRTSIASIPGVSGAVTESQYSSAQYRWIERKDDGYPAKSLPPKHGTTDSQNVALPPYSVTVITFDATRQSR